MGWQDAPVVGPAKPSPTGGWRSAPLAGGTNDRSYTNAQEGRQQATQNILARKAFIEQQLDAPLDTSRESLGGIGDMLLRADLARSNKPEEKMAKLQKARPELDVRQVQTAGGFDSLVARPQGAEAFNPVDVKGQTSPGDVGDFLGSMVNAENIAGTLAAVRTGGLSLIPRMLTSGGAAAGGNIIDQFVEKLRGFNDEPIDEGEAVIAGGTSAGGEVLGSLLTGAKGAATGERGLFQPSDTSKEALRISRENEDLPDLTVGQLYPLARRREAQVAATSGVMRDKYDQQQQTLVDSLRAQTASDDLSGLSDSNLMGAGEQMDKDLLQRFGEPQGSEAAVRQGGKSLEQGREAYRTKSKDRIDEKYARALAAATPDIKFDISAAQKEAQNALQGVVGKGPEKKLVTGDVPRALPGDDVLITQGFSPQMRTTLEKLTALDSAMKDNDATGAFEQIKALRGLFYDLKQPNPQTGTYTNESRIASKIYSNLTEAMNNPVGGSPEFTNLYRSASLANKNREDILSRESFVKIAQSENPQALFEQFAKEGNFTALQDIKRTIPPDKFKKFQQGFENYLLLEPESINKTLDNFAKDQSSLRLLMPKAREDQLRILGNASERLGAAPARKLLTAQGDLGARALDIMEKGTDEQFEAYVKSMETMNPGKEKSVKRALLAGSVEKILSKHTSVKGGRVSYNMNAIANELNNLVASGRLKRIAGDANVLKALKDRSTMASILAISTSDVGASLQAAEIAARAVSANPKEAAGGALEVWHNRVWAWALTSPQAVKIVAGSGRPGSPGVDKTIRGLSSVLGAAVDDISNASDMEFGAEEEEEQP